MELAIKILEFFGITKDLAPKYLLFIIVFILAMWILLNIKFKPLETKTTNIESFITRLCGALESGGDIAKIELYKSQSPLKITDKGYKLLEQIGFKESIKNNQHQLIHIIDRMSPKSAFDVEQLSIGIIRFVMSDKDSSIFKKVEDYLYNNPNYNKPEYFKTAGLYLRDKYLEKHPELLPEEKQD